MFSRKSLCAVLTVMLTSSLMHPSDHFAQQSQRRQAEQQAQQQRQAAADQAARDANWARIQQQNAIAKAGSMSNWQMQGCPKR